MKQYLSESDIINFHHPDIQKKAEQLADGCNSKTETVKNCFEFVRDEIRHSADFKIDKITLTASDVLLETTGYCYAKSHLLAALLRVNKIPAGLCYQRLSVYDDGAPFCLHGFNAVYLDGIGWYRLDPRGNKPGVDARFSPPIEKLAFDIRFPEECTFPEIWPEPVQLIVDVLTRHKNNGYADVHKDLPDIDWL